MEGYKIQRKTGRLCTGEERGAGGIYHAVRHNKAVCGTVPGRLSGWSFTEGDIITCPKCLKKIQKEEYKNGKDSC